MSATDIFVILGIFFLLSSAVRYGFAYALFWPLATLTSGLLSLIVYFLSCNLWATLAAYMAFAFLIKRLLSVWHKKPGPEYSPDLISRLLASILNIAWGLFLAFLIVLSLSIVPFERLGLTNISRNILHSRTYQWIAETLNVPRETKAASPASCPSCDPQLQAMLNTPITQELLRDPRILQLVGDPEFQDALSKKDMARLAKHPIIHKLRQDPGFLLQALRLHMSMRPQSLE